MDVRVGLYRKLSDKELMLLKWCWRLLRLPWTARRSNQSILKEINPEYSLQGLTLKLKFQYFGYLMRRTDSFEKTLMLGNTEGRRRRGRQRMRWLNGIPTQWTWVWVSSGSCWWTRKPGMLQSMGLQRFGHDWVTELSCYIPTILSYFLSFFSFFFLNHWKVKLSVLWQIYSKIIQYVCL